MKDRKNINLEYVINDGTAHEVAVEIQQNCGNKYSDSERLKRYMEGVRDVGEPDCMIRILLS